MVRYIAGRIRTRGDKNGADVYAYIVRRIDKDSGDPAKVMAISEIARVARRKKAEVLAHVQEQFRGDQGEGALDITEYIHELTTTRRREQYHARRAAAGNPVAKTKAEKSAKLRAAWQRRMTAIFDSVDNPKDDT